MIKVTGITGAEKTEQNPRGLVLSFDEPYVLNDAGLLVEGYNEGSDGSDGRATDLVMIRLLTADCLTGETAVLLSFGVVMAHLVEPPALLVEEYDPTIANDEQFDEFTSACCESGKPQHERRLRQLRRSESMIPPGEIWVSKYVLAGLKRRIEFLESGGFDLTKPGMREAVEALEAEFAVCDSATANAISNITKLYDVP